jgi:SynChlorMet cassette radical SAM/SPASM protein ScmE
VRLQALKAPSEIVIAVTGRCNLACTYCYYADEMIALQDLPTETWQAFFIELREMGVMRVILSGGEPFIRQDIWELVDGIVKNKMRFSILTNGTLVTQEIAEQLVAYRQRLNYIQVSVDGSCAETHDKLRGKGSFARMIQGLVVLKKYKLPLTVRVTVNKLNFQDLEGILNLLYHELEISGFGVNEAYPRGAGQCNNTILEMSPEERRHTFRVMQAFDREHPGVAKGLSAGPLFMADYFEKIEKARETGIFEETHPTGYLTGCNVMWQKISVLHDGTYVPCHQLPHIALGQVGQDRLRDVWSHSTGLQALRSRHSVALNTLANCHGCDYQHYCTGGCPGIAYAMTGEVNTINPLDCYRSYVGQDPVYAH